MNLTVFYQAGEIQGANRKVLEKILAVRDHFPENLNINFRLEVIPYVSHKFKQKKVISGKTSHLSNRNFLFFCLSIIKQVIQHTIPIVSKIEWKYAQ